MNRLLRRLVPARARNAKIALLASIGLLAACGAHDDGPSNETASQLNTSWLVGRWDLSPGNANTVLDYSGNGNTGTIESLAPAYALPTYSTDGPSLAMNANGWVHVPASSSLATRHLTVVMWLKNGQADALRYALSMGGRVDNSVDPTFGVWAGNTGVAFFVRTAYSGTSYAPRVDGSLWKDGNWHQLVGTYDGTVVREYIDGNEVGSGAAASGDLVHGASDDLWINSNRGNGTSGFTGNVRDVRIFSEALGPGEIALLDQGHSVPLEEPQVPTDAILPVLPGDGNVVVSGDNELSVTDAGTAVYSIPIEVPPGRAGVEPKLTLAYSSGAGNGMEGVGWTLAGAPRITRCARDPLHDHRVVAPVDFTASSNVFCLNGQRLVPIDTRGVTDTAEFRLYHDDFSRIVMHKPDSLGPTWFERFTKDGRTEVYGAGPHSRTEGTAQQTFVNAATHTPDYHNFPVRYAWGISKVSDRAGNFMQYDYGADENGPEPLLTAIEYTGAQRDPTLTRKVTFAYENRGNGTPPGDFERLWISGLPLTHVWRLKTISTYAPGPGAPGSSQLARMYVLNYGLSPMTGKSLLQRVQDCDSDPRPGAVLVPSNRIPLCRQASFEYENGASTYTRVDTKYADVQTLPAPISGAPSRLQIADFDGDGKDDVLFTKASDPRHLWYMRGLGNNLSAPIDTGIGAQGDFGPRILDFDADGMADIVTNGVVLGAGTGGGPTMNNVYRSPGNGAPFTVSEDLTKWFFAEAMDMNGDRLPDLLLAPNNAEDTRPWWLATNLGGATPPPFELGVSPGWLMMPSSHRQIDLDGDGAAELLVPETAVTTGQIQYLQSIHIYGAPGSGGDPGGPYVNTGIATRSTVLPAQLGPGGSYTFMDLNGDGLTDVLYNSTQPAFAVQRMINGGAGFFQQDITNNLPGEYSIAAKRVADVNLDGHADLVYRMPVQGGASVITAATFGPDGSVASTINVGSTILNRTSENEIFETLDVNGDGLDDFLSMDGGTLQLLIRDGKKPDMLTHVSGLLGHEARVVYSPISSRPRAADCAYPIHCINSKVWVVGSHAVDDGTTNLRQYSHAFFNARSDMLSGAFLGFLQHEIYDGVTGTTIDRYFHWNHQEGTYPLSTGPDSVVVATPLSGGVTHKHTVSSTYGRHDSDAGTMSGFTYASTIDTKDSEGGTTILHRTVSQSVDGWGNITDKTELWPEAKVTRSVHTEMWNDAWGIPSSPFRISETSTDANGASQTRTTGYDYDANGLLWHEVEDPGTYGASGFSALPQPQPDGVVTLFTTFGRNTDGLVEKTTRTDGKSVRWTATSYDGAERMFPVASYNSAGHTTQAGYIPSLGVAAVIVDENGHYTRRQYDGFGRLRTETTQYGDDTTVSYATAPSWLPYTQVTKSVAGAPSVMSVIDTRGHDVLVETSYRADGKVVSVTKSYDQAGRLATESYPAFKTTCKLPNCIFPPQTQYAYDNLSRPTLQTNADGSTIQHQYAGAKTTTTSTSGTQSYVLVDTAGRTIKSAQLQTAVGSKGAHEVPVTFNYGPFDTTKAVTDGAGNALVSIYDRRGRPIATKDPDAGVRKITYNAFGEVSDLLAGGAWNNGSPSGGEETRVIYDSVGRVIERDSVDGVATYTYDTALRGNNRLATMKSAQGVITSYKYDIHSRVYSTNTTVAGQSFVVGQSYDDFGRPSVTTYPVVQGGPAFQLETLYSAGGQVVGVKDDVSGLQYWTLKDSDATELFDVEGYGNGNVRTVSGSSAGALQGITVTNAAGARLQSFAYGVDGHNRVRDRKETVGGVSEHFDYDGLNRMIRWKWSRGTEARSVFYDIDDLGDIQHKTIESGPGTSVTYGYAPAQFGPHAVTSDNRGSFAYDAQGRQTSAPGRTATYSAFDLPKSVTASGKSYIFTYDAANSRVERAAANGDAIVSIGGIYEKRKTGGTNLHVLHVMVAGKHVAEVQMSESGGVVSATKVLYLHGDHLGTVTLTTSATGTVVDNLGYEPFGERVKPVDANVPVNGTPHGVRVGFTGQTEDDELSLIDMKGRMYDPAIGRFLSADPHVTNPADSQSYDRYAYARNNPVNNYDPTGFDGDQPDMGVVTEADNDKVVIQKPDGTLQCVGVCPSVQTTQSGDSQSDDQGVHAKGATHDKPQEAAGKTEQHAGGTENEHKAVGEKDPYKELLEKLDRFSGGGRGVDTLFKISEGWFEKLKLLQEEGKVGKSGPALLKMESRLSATSKAFGWLGLALGAYVTYQLHLSEHPKDYSGAVLHAGVATGIDTVSGFGIVWLGAEIGGPWGAAAGAAFWAIDGISSAVTGNPTVSGRVAERAFGIVNSLNREQVQKSPYPQFPHRNPDFWP